MGSPEFIIDAALWPVTCRAHETRRGDRVLVDPFAPHLATGRGEALYGEEASNVASFVQAIASATIDEVLQHAITDHHIHTIATLAAGLDTRPYRLELPNDLRWIEADLAPVLGYKVLRLAHAAPHCQVRRINVDLSNTSGRSRILRKMAKDVTRGLVLTEGIATMLGRKALHDLIERMPPVFKYWIVDTIEPPRHLQAPGRTRDDGRAYRPRDTVDAFASRQWRPTEFRPLKDQARRLDAPRATALTAATAPGDLEGVWLFQHAL
jgi:O-methyltransferase involved in polyketide biosynthesis